MCNKVRKGLIKSIDDMLDKHNVDMKLFGLPVEDFDIKDMTTSQMSDMKRVLSMKINKFVIN
jgi:hypothetical protein